MGKAPTFSPHFVSGFMEGNQHWRVNGLPLGARQLGVIGRQRQPSRRYGRTARSFAVDPQADPDRQSRLFAFARNIGDNRPQAETVSVRQKPRPTGGTGSACKIGQAASGIRVADSTRFAVTRIWLQTDPKHQVRHTPLNREFLPSQQLQSGITTSTVWSIHLPPCVAHDLSGSDYLFDSGGPNAPFSRANPS